MEIITMKKCSACTVLPIERFDRRAGGEGYRSQCRDCKNAAERARYQAKTGASPRPVYGGYDHRAENAAFRNWRAAMPVAGVFSPGLGLVVGRAAA